MQETEKLANGIFCSLCNTVSINNQVLYEGNVDKIK